MAKISELPPSTGSLPERSSGTDFNSKTMRTTKPGLKRLLLTFSMLVSFLLGFAFLCKTVEIYRSPLPFDEMDAISKEIESSHVQCHFQAVFLNLKSSPSSDFKPNCLYGCDGIGNVVNFTDEDAVVDEALRSVLDESCVGFGGKMYTAVVVVNGGALDVPRAIVGKYRHGWIVGKELDAEDATGRVVEMFVKVFINGAREEGGIHGEFTPVGADGRIFLSFSLLNSNPEDWIYDWDFQRLDETLLKPVIEALKPIANISVESQVLYYTPKSAFSRWDESFASYVFSTKELPLFVNSNEWHLDTSVAAGGRSKILQFLVYVPSSDECPLALQLPSGEISRTNGCGEVSWSGIHKAAWRIQIASFLLDTCCLMMNLGRYLKFSWDSFGNCKGAGCLVTATRFNLRPSGTTLGSLSRLVPSLPQMIIKDEIGKQVTLSLKAPKFAQSNASAGLCDASTVSVGKGSEVIGRGCVLPPADYVCQLLLLRALFHCLLAILPASVFTCSPCRNKRMEKIQERKCQVLALYSKDVVVSACRTDLDPYLLSLSSKFAESGCC